jgi:RNA-binding protein Nova
MYRHLPLAIYSCCSAFLSQRGHIARLSTAQLFFPRHSYSFHGTAILVDHFERKYSQVSAKAPASSFTSSMKLLVPDRLAGAIIGKGGSGIVDLETQTGCSLRLSASGVYFPGTSERMMVVNPHDAAAYEKVIPVLVERLNAPSSSPFSEVAGDMSASSSSSVAIMRLVLTNTACSFLIGKGGETIKSLCQKTGAMIRASDRIDHPATQERIVEVRGLFDSVVAAVKDIILDKVAASELSSKDLPSPVSDSALYHSQFGLPTSPSALARSAVDQFPITIKFPVPGHSVGAIIGKSGETRSRIVQITGAKVQVSERTADHSADREISVTGPLAAVKAALTLIIQQVVETQ